MTIIFDSGIRTGSDVMKAIALGAHAVAVGRLYVWGMSNNGVHGCRHVIKSLLAVSKLLSLEDLGSINIDFDFFPSLSKTAILRLFEFYSGPGYNDDCSGVPEHYG